MTKINAKRCMTTVNWSNTQETISQVTKICKERKKVKRMTVVFVAMAVAFAGQIQYAQVEVVLQRKSGMLSYRQRGMQMDDPPSAPASTRMIMYKISRFYKQSQIKIKKECPTANVDHFVPNQSLRKASCLHRAWRTSS